VAVRRSSLPRPRPAVVPFPGGGRTVRRVAALLPRGRTLLAAAMLVCAGAGAYAAARATSVFDVRTIEVRGASPSTAGEVRDALEPLVAESLLALDGEDLVRRAESIPVVAEAGYDRAFPHTLVVTIREERPAAVLRRGSQAWLVAASGRVLRQVTLAKSAFFPRIWVKKRIPLAAGEAVADRLAARAVAAVARVAKGFPSRVRDVRTGPEELTFRLASGLELRLGDDRELALKLAIAGRILPTLAAAPAGGPEYLDVSVVERPVAGGGNPQLEGGA
jgi:cell division protein FtsQ